MKNILHPKWLFLVNTLPVAIFLILSGLEFSVVRTLLDEKALLSWGVSMAVILGMATTTLLYSLRATYLHKNISPIYSLLTLGGHILYIVLYLFYFEKILWDIPNWMIAPDFILYVVTFLMPTVIHALFVLVLTLSHKKFENGWLNLLVAMLIPFSIFIFLQMVLPFWNFGGGDVLALIMIIAFCFVTLVFLFFIIRGIYLIFSKKEIKSSKYAIIGNVLIGIVLPIAGLLCNHGIIDKNFINTDSGVFGNFSSIGFYGLALVNGILICLPNTENPKYRLGLLAARTLTFAYVFYFFVVFLPFLPLSILAIIAVGFGFLMLTPLVLFIVQSRIIFNDFSYLRSFYAKEKLTAIMIIAFLIIPTTVTINYLNDKKVLNETLDYIYYPDYSKKYELKEASIRRILSNVNAHKGESRLIAGYKHIPFLSRFYTWLVLDNMTLSDAKIKKIENVFFGKFTEATITRGNFDRNESDIHITNVAVKSTYDAQQDAWLSWVDLEMKNSSNSLSWNQEEYDVAFDLPAGCWISDYYLTIDGKKEYGILSEKRAAVWIYQQITNTNRDPGLLNYIAADKVRFRIFPFVGEEARTSGIQFVHKEPMELQIDNQKIQLGVAEQQQPITTATDWADNAVYFSASAKSKLPQVKRSPYYHFIIDISKEMKKNKKSYTKKINEFIKTNKVDLTKAEFNFTNKYSTISNGKDWQKQLENQTFEGGFYVERAIEKGLFNAYKNRKKEYPIMVVVSENNLERFISENNFSDFKIIYPESNQYYKIENNGQLTNFNLIKNSTTPMDTITSIPAAPMVLAYPNAKNPVAFLPNDNAASIVLKSEIATINIEKIKNKSWETGLIMQSNWLSQTLHPEIAEEQYYELVAASFKSNILTPPTSFIALENEAQKQMLKKKQKEVLMGNKALDLGEMPDEMPEPESWIVLMFVGLFIWFRKRKL